MFKWNMAPEDNSMSDKYLIENAIQYKSYVIEAAVTRILLEMIEWMEQNDFQDQAVEASTRSHKKSR